MHSWLNRTQLEQRPSSEFSKPEQRIWRIDCQLGFAELDGVLSLTLRLLQYLHAIAVRWRGADWFIFCMVACGFRYGSCGG